MVNYLYMHIPFCIKKCVYCDFYSILFKAQIAENYIKALCKEIGMRKCIAGNLQSVYIGGGTPTMLSEQQIAELFKTLHDSYSVNAKAEITIEANPRTITEGKAESLLKSGINRISIGVQSFIDAELKTLGRSHNADDAVKALSDARQAGFSNISLDLIYGIPGQKMDDWERSLGKAIELAPEHISAYELTPEVNTPLYEDLQSGQLSLPDEETIAEMYYRCIDMLEENGYTHYEISNYAKPGYESIHNLNYWNRGEYLGLGAGAHSFYHEQRMVNARDVQSYIESVNKGALPLAESNKITGEEALKELIFLGMRKTEGIDMRHIPTEKKAAINKAVDELLPHGLAEFADNRLRLTRKGLLLSNEVIVKVLLCIETSCSL